MRNEADRMFQVALMVLLVAVAITVAVMLQGKIGEAFACDTNAPLCVSQER